jgi:KAT8 regulatory NSL complex subunit 2
MRDKLIRLQKLYIDQFQRLQHLFKEERRQYCHSVRREREEQLMSVHSQPKETSEEVASYEAVRALNHYNKPQGLEAVLYQMLMEKRQRAAAASGGGHLTETTMASASNASLPKCSFNLTTNTKCGEVAVPMSKFCMKHVMSDSTQVLFRACGVTTTADDGPCETPVPDLFESTTCVFHTQLQGSIYEDKVRISALFPVVCSIYMMRNTIAKEVL